MNKVDYIEAFYGFDFEKGRIDGSLTIKIEEEITKFLLTVEPSIDISSVAKLEGCNLRSLMEWFDDISTLIHNNGYFIDRYIDLSDLMGLGEHTIDSFDGMRDFIFLVEKWIKSGYYIDEDFNILYFQ